VFWAIDYTILGMIVVSAVMIVRLRNLNGAVMALSAVGTLLGLIFIVLGAPDDAHAEIVVGTIALPTIFLVAIAKVRPHVVNQSELGERSDEAPSERTTR
jgi:uncharacterized MnhB-related membrane protein